jgi:hypothetical protein
MIEQSGRSHARESGDNDVSLPQGSDEGRFEDDAAVDDARRLRQQPA